MTSLFTRIACSKKDGVNFPRDFDRRARGPDARHLVQQLLECNPCERLGNLAEGPDAIRKHPHFDGIDFNKLRRTEVPPPWRPVRKVPLPARTDDHEHVPEYTGSGETFADW
ncbi:unnamed protein product [Phaeothamnion confervicola]